MKEARRQSGQDLEDETEDREKVKQCPSEVHQHRDCGASRGVISRGGPVYSGGAILIGARQLEKGRVLHLTINGSFHSF